MWLADQLGILVSTDGSKPLMAVTWKDRKRAGALADTWEENVRLTVDRLERIRETEWYKKPPMRLKGFWG